MPNFMYVGIARQVSYNLPIFFSFLLHLFLGKEASEFKKPSESLLKSLNVFEMYLGV